ncbi:MAG TPA: O-antigen ligase family protein [Sphingomicrobium sp.]|nr:O-antigen ligase family protein [Sphingomicrobium sp.]
MDLRLVGLPVLLVEIAFILLAFREGWRPLQQIAALSRAVRLLLALLIGTALASAIFAAPDRGGALLWTYLSMVHLMFGFTAAWRIAGASEIALSLVWPWITAGCCAYAIILAVYVMRPHPVGFDWEYFGLGVSNIRQVGFYCEVGAMAAIGCSVLAQGTKTLIYAAAATSMFALACWSGSRGALLAAFVTLISACLFVRRFRTFRAGLISIVSLVLGAGTSLLLPSPELVFGVPRMLSSIESPGLDDLTSGRFRMWEGAWHAFLQRPFLGYGEGQFGHVVPQVQAIYLQPHNLVLQLLFQWGLIGTVIVGFLAILAARHIHSTGLADETRALPSILVLVGLSAYSFYDGSLFHAYPSMMFAFALASALTLGSAQNRIQMVTG